MSLTDLQCKQSKAKDKTYTLSDGMGLMLEIRPSGKKYWISRIYRQGKERRRSLGKYPDVSVRTARAKNVKLRSSFDPSSGDLFKAVADEWMETKCKGILSPGYIRTLVLRLNKYILPAIGNMPINEIKATDILNLCRTIEASGFAETSHRVKNLIGQICRYSISTGRIEMDPTSALYGALKTAPERHYATITSEDDISVLMKRCNAYGSVIVRHAILFSIYTFCRPGEVRKAEWSEIDMKKAEWRIPAEKMKMKRPHIVPLCTQCIDLLKSLKQFTGYQRWLFPSSRNDGRPMSDGTVRIALRTMGYEKKDITPHGFRAMASTVLNEHEFPPDVIETQLAHSQGNTVRAAYNHARYLDQRREMMQWWGNWLEGVMRR